MSWDTFKKNILRLSDNPNSIPNIDKVAKAYATEYDACIKRGGDSINGISVKQGNVQTMELFFKVALSKGLIQTVGYDIVGEMGQGVIAYWSGAVLEKYPVPIFPALGSTLNVNIESAVVLVPGVWKPPLFIPPSLLTKNVIDLFILYAQTHLLTVSGIINTTSLYPPLLTPGPGVINWVGYSVTPADKTKSIKLSALPIMDDYQKAPLDVAINMSSYNGAAFNVEIEPITTILDDGVVRDNDNENTSTTYETTGKDAALYIEPAQFEYNPSNDGGLDYSGYDGAPLSPSDTLKKIYIPVLDVVHKDKPKGLRILMAAQTQVEGFFTSNGKRGPSKSFRTNNPGNVYPNGSKAGFATLALGVEAQWRYIHGPIFSGTSKYYKPSFTLFKYLSIYAPVGDGANNPNSYTNLVVGYFRSQGYKNVDGNTTLEEIKNLK